MQVLDARRRPAPVGVVGEIYVGGAGVARGYLRRPELTAARFVADPGDAGRTLYRSGDRARRLPSGELEYLGRDDDQVKIRGFRIELGEIEAVLGRHPEVRACAATVREDTAGDRRVVAYVVGEGSAPALDPAGLRAFAKERLPEYMVPSAFVRLAALPLTSNGKLDRRALPAPGAEALAGREYVAPRGPVEEAIAGVFAEVLDLPAARVGAHDGFFELGGHSLLATMAVARIRARLGMDLPLRALFEAPAPAELAVHLGEAGGATAPPIARALPGASAPLSFGQERLWFLAQLDPADTSYHEPARFRLSGPLDVGALERALAEIVRRHEVLRTTFPDAGGVPVPRIHDGAAWRLDVMEVATEAEARRAAAAEAEEPFDLATGPLLRARLLRLSEREHLLLLTMHHVVSDAWSTGVLHRELGALYEAFREGRSSPLAELPVQYADFAAWQRSLLQGEVLEQQLAYWREQLRGAPALDLPTDRPRPPVLSTRGASRRFAVAPATSRGLGELARRAGATLFMTLLATFDALLHRTTGQRDLAVGTPIAGRTRPEIEPLVGFFVNTLVIRAAWGGDATFLDLLARVRESCLGAYAHQDVPFELLVGELAPSRDLARTPLFQVLFTLLHAGDALRLGGLTVSGVGAETTTAKFELTLGIRESGDELSGELAYNTDLFDAETIDRLVARY